MSQFLYLYRGGERPTGSPEEMQQQMQRWMAWMKAIAIVDPFTYAVHGFKQLVLKNTGLMAISGDLFFLLIFTALAMSAATLLFRRTL